MKESPYRYAVLFFKLFLDRRPFRGPREFAFRISAVERDYYRFRISSREGVFRRAVALRRRTSDLATFEQVFANNDYNLRRLGRWDEILRLYDAICKDGTPLILDLGANIGLSALYFAKNWPAAHIIAVEPDKENFRVMRKNLDGLRNTLPVNAAVASEDGAVRIVDPTAESWALRTERAAPGATDTISAVSVESLIERAPRNCKPFIAKIDIEGFESELFSQNTDWLRSFPIIIIELHDWLLPGQGTSNNFLRAVAHEARDFVFIGENVVSISNTSSADQPAAWEVRNSLYPDESNVQGSCQFKRKPAPTKARS
jgi:FkbM family methyltransferase